ncbi:phage portal protein [Mycobacterium sp. G7A2]|uniref:phage portal protein n=1 Tax=Mycobacterium sp. G7A2 TaxID=3317307 RepID=UPI0035A912A4
MGFVVSEGSVRQLSRLDQPLPPRMVLGGYSQDYLGIWRRQYAVRTTVTFLARNIAQLGLPVFRRKGDNDRERLNGHPLAELIRRPNPWTSRYRFLDSLVHDLAIFDVSYWVKARTPDGMSLLRLDPAATLPKGNAGFYPEWFEFRGVRGMQQFPADQILFFRGYCGGLSDVGGVPPIESLRAALEEDYYASSSRAQVVRNGARISGYLKRPAEATWSVEARNRFRQQWQAQYTGNGPEAGGTPILEDGMEFVPAAMTPKDLQYIESRKLLREEVASAYYIPPPMLGLLENATFSNIVQQHRMLYQDTLGPWLSMIQDEIALQLIPDMPDNDDLYVEFNLAEKMRGDFEQRQAAIVQSVGAPYRTINEGRALDNLPPVEGGDELIRPLNITQPGDHNPIPAEDAPLMTPTESDPDEDDDEDDGLKHLRHNGSLVSIGHKEG